MRVQLSFSDVGQEDLPHVIEALGQAEIESGHNGRFNVTSRYYEGEDSLRWLGVVFETMDRYVFPLKHELMRAVEAKRSGRDCDEDTSAKVKGWLTTHDPYKTHDKLAHDLVELFPLEWAEVEEARPQGARP